MTSKLIQQMTADGLFNNWALVPSDKPFTISNGFEVTKVKSEYEEIPTFIFDGKKYSITALLNDKSLPSYRQSAVKTDTKNFTKKSRSTLSEMLLRLKNKITKNVIVGTLLIGSLPFAAPKVVDYYTNIKNQKIEQVKARDQIRQKK
jgi:hypothetical protein